MRNKHFQMFFFAFYCFLLFGRGKTSTTDVRGDGDDFMVQFKWTNDSPYVYTLDTIGTVLDVPEFIYQFPWVIGPNSSIEFSFSRNMTCVGCINVIQYQALLGNIGDVPNIIAGISSFADDYLDKVKRMGTLQLHFMNEDRDASTIGIVSESFDLFIPNKTFINSSFVFKAGANPWYYSEGIVRIVGDPLLVNMTTGRGPSSVTTADLLVHWQEVDPDLRGQFMKDLQECVFAGSAQDLSSLYVLDDFDSGYNSVGWSIGTTLNANLYDPLQSYSDAINYYNFLGLVETNCSDDNVLESQTRPSIALYCQPANDSFNGGCIDQDLVSSGYNYTHIAVKTKEFPEVWTSKLGYGPLLAHDFLDNLTRSSNNCTIRPSIGKPVLCFRTPLNLRFNIQNTSPYVFHVENITLYSGNWKDNKQPLSLLNEFTGTDTYEVRGNKEVEGMLWYRVDLGNKDINQSKTLGYFSLVFHLLGDSEESNVLSIYDTVSANDTNQDLFNLTYYSQTTRDGSWQFLSLSTSGYPVTINLTGNSSINGTASRLSQKWEELDPTVRGATLEEIARCIFQNETVFNESQVLDDFDDNYNSFGWTVDNTLRGNYLNPSDSYEEALHFYESCNYTIVDCSSSNAMIALFCNLNSTNNQCTENYNIVWGTYNYTHAAKKLSNGDWSSKFWSGPLLTHPDLASISGKQCENLQHIPSLLGQPILCFQQNNISVDTRHFTLTKLVDKTKLSAKGLGLDFSSTIDVENNSPYNLVRPYEQKWNNVCQYLWYFGNCHNEPAEQNFAGITDLIGTWKSKPDRWIYPFDKDHYLLQDRSLKFAGSGAAITYDISLGDFWKNVMTKKDFKGSDVMKNLGQVTLNFACPFSDNNVASISTTSIMNPATLTIVNKKWTDTSKNRNLHLILSELTIEGTVDGKNPTTGGISPTGRPIKVSYQITQTLKLAGLLNAWIGTSIDYNDYAKFAGPDIIRNSFYAFKGSYTVGTDAFATQINCQTPIENQKACNALVYDDADHTYNCASWAAGRTTGGFFYYPLESRRTMMDWASLNDYDYVDGEGCFSKNPDAEIVAYCDRPNKGYKTCQISQKNFNPTNGTLLLYTHMAKKFRGRWTSKLGFGPLVEHDSPNDFETGPTEHGYGFIGGCLIPKKSFPSAVHERTDMFAARTFTRRDSQMIEQLAAQIPSVRQEQFTSLRSIWAKDFIQVLPGIIGVDYVKRLQIEKESRKNLVEFMQSHPETIPLLIRHMMSLDGTHEYLIFETLFEMKCTDDTLRTHHGHDCAKDWIENQRVLTEINSVQKRVVF